MPRYRFTSPWPEVFSDLQQGVNATLTRDGQAPPDGSTLLLLPGDEVFINEPYSHAHLVEITDDTPPADAPAAPPTPAPAESEPSAEEPA